MGGTKYKLALCSILLGEAGNEQAASDAVVALGSARPQATLTCAPAGGSLASVCHAAPQQLHCPSPALTPVSPGR